VVESAIALLVDKGASNRMVARTVELLESFVPTLVDRDSTSPEVSTVVAACVSTVAVVSGVSLDSRVEALASSTSLAAVFVEELGSDKRELNLKFTPSQLRQVFLQAS
jgi:hypothetical protein